MIRYMRTLFVLFAMSTLLLSSCGKGDGEQDYGYGYVMMPQSQRIESYYAVPSGGGEYTYNFKIEEGKIKVFLGVLRSGNVKDEAFSVDIVVDKNQAQNYVNKTANAELMPEGLYTFPDRADIAGDSNQAAFYLEIETGAIVEGDYDGKKLVVCIALANPTKFELARDYSSTMVVLNVDEIKKFL